MELAPAARREGIKRPAIGAGAGRGTCLLALPNRRRGRGQLRQQLQARGCLREFGGRDGLDCGDEPREVAPVLLVLG